MKRLSVVENADGTFAVWDDNRCRPAPGRTGYATREDAERALALEHELQATVDASRDRRNNDGGSPDDHDPA